MAVFRMPSLGADMEAGKLVEWLVQPGDAVRRGQVVAVVETQKGAIEIECFEEGRVERLAAAVGQTLPVGAPLAEIVSAGEPAAPVVAGKPAMPEAAAPPAAPSAPPARPPGPAVAGGAPWPAAPPASPAARARAAELGLDLTDLRGTGPGGAVLLADVEAAAPPTVATPMPAPAPPRAGKPGLDLAAMRQAIAAAMARSKREIPHYYLARSIDLQPATDWLAATNAARPPEARLLMGALFLRATAIAARAVPEISGHYVDGAFRPAEGVHVGLAVSLRGGGLVTPAIRDTDKLGLDALMASMRDLVERARVGRLRSSEMTDGTITMTSLGEGGADMMTGVIYPPQVAIIGFGAPGLRPWVVGDAVVPRTVVTVTLAADHRVSDGRRGARALDEINRLLQNPEAL